MSDGKPDERVVWVVDDNPLDLERARRVLLPHYRVEVFHDGSEVLERISDRPQPDVLVVDWVMPGISGLDVCQFLRASGEEIPVLLVTAQGATEQLVEGLAAGASDYVAKPYADAELAARTAALVRTRELLERARSAEATVSRLLAVSPDPLFACDRDGCITYANPSAQRALNLKEPQIIGRHLSALVPGLDLQLLAGRGRLETPPDIRIGDQLYAPSMGTSPHGFPAVAVALRNVTARREQEARRLDLYSIIAHDLRSPLSAMLMRTELILNGNRGLLAAELAGDLRGMQRNIRELVAMINDFLELARYEGGGYKLDYKELDLCDLLRQTVDDYQPLSDASNIRMSLATPACEAKVIGDKRRLAQAVSNLIANAIKFTPEGGVITLDVETGDEFVTARVTDTGSGIDPASAATLFQRYYRTPETQHKVPGTGLGLMIVREIIELHGGSVGVNSALGRGSTFWFRLPRPTALRASA